MLGTLLPECSCGTSNGWQQQQLIWVKFWVTCCLSTKAMVSSHSSGHECICSDVMYCSVLQCTAVYALLGRDPKACLLPVNNRG